MNNLKLITDNPKYLLLVDEKDRQWGKVAYNVDTKEVEFICSHPKYDEHGIKIVAHLPKAGAPLLEGVMLMVDLPMRIGTDSDAIALEESDILSHIHNGGNVSWGTAKAILARLQENGYLKAASKQYTEDDIDAAFLAGSNHQNEVEELRFQAEDFNTALNRFKDSLSPVPVLPVDYQIDTHEICPEVLCQIKGRCNDENKCQKRMIYTTIPNEQGVEVLQGKWIY